MISISVCRMSHVKSHISVSSNGNIIIIDLKVKRYKVPPSGSSDVTGVVRCGFSIVEIKLTQHCEELRPIYLQTQLWVITCLLCTPDRIICL